jgi:hypothetical protein
MCRLASNEDKVGGEMGRYLEQIFQVYYDSFKPAPPPLEEKRGDGVIYLNKYFKDPEKPGGYLEGYRDEEGGDLYEDLKSLGADNISLEDIQALQYYLESIRNDDGRQRDVYGDDAGLDSGDWANSEDDLSQGSPTPQGQCTLGYRKYHKGIELMLPDAACLQTI